MSVVQDIFTDIYEQNRWDSESRSGAGSTSAAAENIAREIPVLLRSIGASSMLDIPCGDLMWMKDVDLDGVDYIGADIVEALIESNRVRFAAKNRCFMTLNLLEDRLPKVDVVLTRDCFIHLTLPMIVAALDNIVASGSGWLLASHYPWRGHASNNVIESVSPGGRRVNLEIAPFNFPPPYRSIPEGEPFAYGADKSLCLWPIEWVALALTRIDRDNLVPVWPV
jgi:hypothetical protein